MAVENDRYIKRIGDIIEANQKVMAVFHSHRCLLRDRNRLIVGSTFGKKGIHRCFLTEWPDGVVLSIYRGRYGELLGQGRRNDFWVGGGLKSLYWFLGGLNRLFREFLLGENDLWGEFLKSWVLKPPSPPSSPLPPPMISVVYCIRFLFH